MPPDRILITGFEPFAGQSRNPSEDVVRAVSKSLPGGELVAEILPVEYAGAGERLRDLITAVKPRYWIGLGLNQWATAITLERLAHNLDDAPIPDNAGELRQGVLIDPQGAETYRSTLPLEAITATLSRLNIPIVYSDSAGRFVCNHVFYLGCAVISLSKLPIAGGFIHIPWPSDWAHPHKAAHLLDLARITQAVQAIITSLGTE